MMNWEWSALFFLVVIILVAVFHVGSFVATNISYGSKANNLCLENGYYAGDSIPIAGIYPYTEFKGAKCWNYEIINVSGRMYRLSGGREEFRIPSGVK